MLKYGFFIVVMTLLCLPVWAGTWVENFNGGDLNSWLKFEYGLPPIADAKWDVIHGEVVAIIEGQRQFDDDMIIFPAAGWILPSQAFSELTEQDDLIVEVSLKVEKLANLRVEPTDGEGNSLIGMVIAHKDDEFLYRVAWSLEPEKIEIHFLGPAYRLMDASIKGVGPVPIQAEMGNWYRMRLMIKQRPFQVKIYWDGALIKEFGAPFILRAEDDIFPPGLQSKDDAFLVRSVGLWAEGFAFRAYFDDFFVAWGDSVKDLHESAIHPKHNLVTTWGEIKTNK